jgi:FKBP-type peptidyl-prolyl cis-trans isomerase 2
MAEAKAGDRVMVHYTGSLEDGTVFGSSVKDQPLEFTIGRKDVLPAFEDAVLGMNTGETKNVSIPPENGFGHHKEDLVFDVERSRLPLDIHLELGKVLQVRSQDGNQYPVTIVHIGDNRVKFDGNHPLAGQVLNLEIQLVEIL